MGVSYFGLEVGEKFLKVVDCNKKGSFIELKKIGKTELPFNIYTTDSEDDLAKTAEFLKKLLKDLSLKKKEVNIVIPDGVSYTQIVEMPEMTEKELSSAIRYHADQFIPVAIDKVGIDVEIIYRDENTKKNQVLLVACPNSILDKLTDIAELTGLTPTSIENEASAIIRLFFDTYIATSPHTKTDKSPDSQNRVILNVGITSSSLYLLDVRKGIPLHIHNFSLGLEIFIKDLKANYNISETDITKLFNIVGFSGANPKYDLSKILQVPLTELLSEVERFMAATKSKYSMIVKDIYLLGEGFLIRDFEKKLAETLKVNVERLDIFESLLKNDLIAREKSNITSYISSIGATIR